MNKCNNPTVCFFDSGIGGLSLLYECVRKLPQTDFIYFADNYRVPYGALNSDELIKLVDGIFAEIALTKPAAVVVACNTVTAHCIDFLRNKYKFKIIGIQPAIKPAMVNGGKCIVLATPSTVKSVSFEKLAEKYGDSNLKVVPCPELATYIEKNIEKLDYNIVKSMLPEERAESVVLGCTHYVFIEKYIKNFYNCNVFDGISGTADHLCEILGIFDHLSERKQKIMFSGGDTAKNRKILSRLLIEGGSLLL